MLRTSYGRPTNITDDLRTAYGRLRTTTDGLRTATDDYGRPPGTRAGYPNAVGVAPDTVALARIPERDATRVLAISLNATAFRIGTQGPRRRGKRGYGR